MPLADARAMYPSLAVDDADPEADRACSKRSRTGATAIRRWSASTRRTACCSTSPAARICSAARRRCARSGAPARARRALRRASRVADTVGCAWAVARYGDSAASCRRRDARQRWSPLPLAALRLDADIVDRAGAGRAQAHRRCASTGRARRSPPASAPDFVRRLDQALGREDEPITPRLPLPSYVAEQRFADPIALRSGRARHHRAARARARSRCWSGAARARGCCRRRCSAPTARCIGSSSAPARRCAIPRGCAGCSPTGLPSLGDACDPGFGLRHGAALGARDRAARSGADRPRRRRPADAELAHLIDRLGARFGLRRVITAGAAGHAYSGIRGCRRAGACGAQDASATCRRSSAGQSRAGASDPPVRAAGADRGHRRGAGRPAGAVSLAACPARGRRVEGPERIAMEWWRDERRPRADARLFPRREQAGRAGLALSRGSLRAGERAADWLRAGTCTVCSRERLFVQRRAGRSARNESREPVRLCRTGRDQQFLLPARRLASGGAGDAGSRLGLAGIGIADRNTVAGVVRAHAADGMAAAEMRSRSSPPFKVAVGARLVFADGTPDILAYPQRPRRLGPADALAVARQAARREGRLSSRLAGPAASSSRAST